MVKIHYIEVLTVGVANKFKQYGTVESSEINKLLVGVAEEIAKHRNVTNINGFMCREKAVMNLQ